MTIFDAIDNSNTTLFEQLLSENPSLVTSIHPVSRQVLPAYVDKALTSATRMLNKKLARAPGLPITDILLTRSATDSELVTKSKFRVSALKSIVETIAKETQRYEARLTSSESSSDHSTNSSPVAPAKPSLEDKMSGMLAKLKTTHDDKKAGSSLNQWFAAEQNLKDIEAAQVRAQAKLDYDAYHKIDDTLKHN
ncbi:MAG: hypothetical protein P1U61_09125 [Legionellaceae bacterium]|nr:hypothetical protein [Legionellaceae bacterium]